VDGNPNVLWGGRSADGDDGSKEVWLGVTGLAVKPKELRVFQSRSIGHNDCRPHEHIVVEVQAAPGAGWSSVATIGMDGWKDQEWNVIDTSLNGHIAPDDPRYFNTCFDYDNDSNLAANDISNIIRYFTDRTAAVPDHLRMPSSRRLQLARALEAEA